MSSDLLLKIDGKEIKLNTYLLTFNSTTPPETIYVGPYRQKVSLYVPNPLRCYKCQKFGHGEKQCRGKKICPNCSEEGHAVGECHGTVICANCKCPHMSSSKDCPNFIRENKF